MQKAPVLVTGATSGLGRKTALALAKAGWPVVVGGRRAELVNELVKEIHALGVDASPFVADQADLDQLRAAIRNLGETELGGIIANAGITTEQNLKT
ncbi:MAG: SDR family oxidoreductase, partial [Pseudomonadales bacterium]|nr:SDR family oxidoreductase [Pseudomonadales bacterium]